LVTDNVNAVVVDEEFGVRAALNHLIELGHTRNRSCCGHQQSSTGVERLRAFRDYMKARGLESGLVVNTKKFKIEEGFALVSCCCVATPEFTAILAGNDLMRWFIDALIKAGKRVPQDVSIVGGNDIPFLSRMVLPDDKPHSNV